MIVILDYGMGNPGSILNMVRKAGGEAVISADLEVVARASGMILPGVGAFDNGMRKLRNLGLVELLSRRVRAEKMPFLGVCLGMQLLFDRSEEGDLPGLGWLKGDVKRFNFTGIEDRHRLKIPMIGWNLVKPVHGASLFAGLEQEARFYFVHSYHAVCQDAANVQATSRYGYDYTCAVKNDNIFGAQFHPEKSHRFGLVLFKNFLEHVAQC